MYITYYIYVPSTQGLSDLCATWRWVELTTFSSSEMGPNSENDHFIRGSHDTFEPMGSKN